MPKVSYHIFTLRDGYVILDHYHNQGFATAYYRAPYFWIAHNPATNNIVQFAEGDIYISCFSSKAEYQQHLATIIAHATH